MKPIKSKIQLSIAVCLLTLFIYTICNFAGNDGDLKNYITVLSSGILISTAVTMIFFIDDYQRRKKEILTDLSTLITEYCISYNKIIGKYEYNRDKYIRNIKRAVKSGNIQLKRMTGKYKLRNEVRKVTQINLDEVLDIEYCKLENLIDDIHTLRAFSKRFVNNNSFAFNSIEFDVKKFRKLHLSDIASHLYNVIEVFYDQMKHYCEKHNYHCHDNSLSNEIKARAIISELSNQYYIDDYYEHRKKDIISSITRNIVGDYMFIDFPVELIKNNNSLLNNPRFSINYSYHGVIKKKFDYEVFSYNDMKTVTKNDGKEYFLFQIKLKKKMDIYKITYHYYTPMKYNHINYILQNTLCLLRQMIMSKPQKDLYVIAKQSYISGRKFHIDSSDSFKQSYQSTLIEDKKKGIMFNSVWYHR